VCTALIPWARSFDLQARRLKKWIRMLKRRTQTHLPTTRCVLFGFIWFFCLASRCHRSRCGLLFLQRIHVNDCYMHFKNVSCAGTFQFCQWDWHTDARDGAGQWQSQPLLPCYDMCKRYVIACTNDPNEVTKSCNDSTKFTMETPCTGYPYTVEAECDSGSILSLSGLATVVISCLCFVTSQLL
jgi:hypothetical protein